MTTEEILEKTIGELGKKGHNQAFLAQIESILSGEIDVMIDRIDKLVREICGID